MNYLEGLYPQLDVSSRSPPVCRYFPEARNLPNAHILTIERAERRFTLGASPCLVIWEIYG